MTTESDPPTNPMIERIEALLADLREAENRMRGQLSEAHSTTKVMDQLIDKAGGIIKHLEAACMSIVRDRYAELVRQGLEEYREDVEDAMLAARQHIYRHFDQIVHIIMTGNRQGRTAGDEKSSLFNLPGVQRYVPLAKPDELRAIEDRIEKRAKARGVVRRRKGKGKRT